MRLFSHHLAHSGSISDYYGIAKLCCALCNYTFVQFQTAGLHSPATRGTHTGLFRWPLPSMFFDNEHMRILLGGIFDQYVGFSDKKRRLESPKKGPFYKLQAVALNIIWKLDTLNTMKNIRMLGIAESNLIEGSNDHYPDNQIQPSLPLEHPSKNHEESLERLQQTHQSNSHPDMVDALEALGRAWKAEKEYPKAHYYLSRVVAISNDFPGAIDDQRLARILNTLGNVCRSLRLFDRGEGYLRRALDLKSKIGDNYQIAVTLNSLGILELVRENLFEAHRLLSEAKGFTQDSSLSNIIERNLERVNEGLKN